MPPRGAVAALPGVSESEAPLHASDRWKHGRASAGNEQFYGHPEEAGEEGLSKVGPKVGTALVVGGATGVAHGLGSLSSASDSAPQRGSRLSLSLRDSDAPCK